MATKVSMEALSPTMEEGRLVKWLKNEGDAVKSGDVLAEVETDKAVMELVARGEGVLRKRLVNEGDAVPVGTLVGVIGSASEDITALLGGSAASSAAVSAPAVAPAVAPAAAPAPAPAPVATGGRTVASPLARRLASDAGVDLQRIAGSGPGGRVVKRDIEAAMTSHPTQSSANSTPARTGSDFTDIPLTQIRKTIARRLAESIGPIPTF